MLGEYIAYRLGRRDERQAQEPRPVHVPTSREAARNRMIGWLLVLMVLIAGVAGCQS